MEAVVCGICPHECSITTGSTGRCGVIKNENSKLLNPYAGRCSTIAVEPIEKRPFFHVVPGSKFLSVGFYGCSFSCDFCQNHRVSQQTDGKFAYYEPQQLVDLAIDYGVAGIAFTYNEPTIYHDYIEEVGNCIQRSLQSCHLKLAIKTSGFVSRPIIRNLCLYADAINVDIKGNNDDYKSVCGGWLDPVLTCIEWIVNMEVHLEISYLVLPDRIDDDRFNIYFRNWLADIDSQIPLHLLYFYPFHRMVVPTYKPSKLLKLRDKMREKLDYVYISNHFGTETSAARDTRCLTCDNIIVNRQKNPIFANHMCCGQKLPGVGMST